MKSTPILLLSVLLSGVALPTTAQTVGDTFDYVKQNNLITIDSMTDDQGHQLPNIIYPGLDRAELVDWVERFYGEYYFRPRVIWRVVSKAMFSTGTNAVAPVS